MAKLSKDKVKAMLPKDMIVVPCDNALYVACIEIAD